jgi:transcriptional regulator with XRE-family HTH domain
MTQPVPAAHALAEPELSRLQGALELAIRHKGWTFTQTSRRLRRYPEYVGRTLSGRADLKVGDVFRLLELLQVEPFDFLQASFPLGGSSVLAAKKLVAASATPERLLVDRLAREGLTKHGAKLDARAWTERAGQLLREVLRRNDQTQADVAAALGLTVSALGQRLRGNSRLLAWQLFAVLRVLKVDAGRFFYELVFPDQSLAAQLTLGEVLDSWEQAQRELAEAAVLGREAIDSARRER